MKACPYTHMAPGSWTIMLARTPYRPSASTPPALWCQPQAQLVWETSARMAATINGFFNIFSLLLSYCALPFAMASISSGPSLRGEFAFSLTGTALRSGTPLPGLPSRSH